MGTKLFVLWSALLYQIQGSSAVRSVFVLKGEDVHLDVQKPVVLEAGSDLKWRHNKTNNIVKLSSGIMPVIYRRYTGRVDFTAENYSLQLKNLQESDSGLYTAVVSGDIEQTVAEYQVTVQERVSPVNLTVASVSSSSGSCRVTVTCSSQDSAINSTLTCDRETCSQEGGQRSEVTTSTASLHAYLFKGSAVCNHSNQVSWSEDREQVDALCWLDSGPPDDNSWHTIVAVVISVMIIVVAFVLVVALILCRRKHRTGVRQIAENTVYDTAKPNTDLTADEHPAGSVDSPFTEYSLVGPHAAPMGAAETRNNTNPESLYAVVQRGAKP